MPALTLDAREAEKMVKNRACSDCWCDLEIQPSGGELIDTATVYCPTEGCQFRGTISKVTRTIAIETNRMLYYEFKWWLWKTNPGIFRTVFGDKAANDKERLDKTPVADLMKELFGQGG